MDEGLRERWRRSQEDNDPSDKLREFRELARAGRCSLDVNIPLKVVTPVPERASFTLIARTSPEHVVIPVRLTLLMVIPETATGTETRPRSRRVRGRMVGNEFESDHAAYRPGGGRQSDIEQKVFFDSWKKRFTFKLETIQDPVLGPRARIEGSRVLGVDTFQHIGIYWDIPNDFDVRTPNTHHVQFSLSAVAEPDYETMGK